MNPVAFFARRLFAASVAADTAPADDTDTPVVSSAAAALPIPFAYDAYTTIPLGMTARDWLKRR